MKNNKKNTNFYSTLVFDDIAMKKYFSEALYKKFKYKISKDKSLDINMANHIAKAMKNWAIKKGATHYTHWFQPLNGSTSEKHDSFLVPKGDNGKAIFDFSGKDLFNGESDASSFPSGGLRATFEARGYTAWDPTSYAFIKDEVLCIPTAFCSYNGHALDNKTPLLRSMRALKIQVKEFLKFFNIESTNFTINVGAEQEFFLIPLDDYKKREDLMLCGRTLFGNSPCKGQELEEHYYGSLKPQVSSFMKHLNKELWALGIPAHTKHNEVAPAQHELAPIYSNANKAVDENLITMEKMIEIANKHNFACLLHEKPFKGINGSGKHCNWSISVENLNLLDPGKTNKDFIRFICFLSCIISAVDNYQDLLRTSIASIGNDCRLGGNEAPPAIVSIYLGKQLEDVINSVIKKTAFDFNDLSIMDLGVSFLPKILRDSSDRNRTSPFAFTSNKFEFRMPGSQINLSKCITVLNTAVAKSIKIFNLKYNTIKDKNKNLSIEESLIETAIILLKKHKRIIFNGNGYSNEWIVEAKNRGLKNYANTWECLGSLLEDKNIKLFEEFKVLNKEEIKSRYLINMEKYNKLVNIEARVMHRMVKRTYLPKIYEYAGFIANNIRYIEQIKGSINTKNQYELLQDLTSGIENINNNLSKMNNCHKKILNLNNEEEKSKLNATKLIPLMKKLRLSIDKMEHITSREFWPVPSYNNMLFYV